MYAEAQAKEQQSGGGAQHHDASGKDDAVDAEFEEVKDEPK
jgi:hypothetical protein